MDQRNAVNKGRRQATPLSESLQLGGMLNFGRTGGMQPGGVEILPDKWVDACMIMDDLNVAFFFAIGCRRPTGVNINRIFPHLTFQVTGHESIGFDAVALRKHHLRRV